MNRRTFIISMGAAALALVASACGGSNPRPPVELAQDKPTLLYFYTPN